MLRRLIAFALAQRLLVAVLTLGLVGAGWLALQQGLHVTVVHSTWFFEFCQQVAGLVRYR